VGKCKIFLALNLLFNSFNEIGKIKGKARELFYSVDLKSAESKNNCSITSKADKSFLIDLFKYFDDSISNEDEITVENFNKQTYSRSFFVQKKSGKKISVSYLNAILKLSNINKRLKKKEVKETEE